MAFSNETYKGITIEFKGKTDQLGASLRDIDKEARTVNSELSEINKGLKLDPKNVDLMSQKFTKANEAIEATKKRLEVLKEAHKQAEQQFNEGKISEQQFKQLEAEIAKSENALKRFGNEAKAVSEKIKNELSSAVDKLANDVKKTAAVTAGIITALGGVTMSAANTADELNTLSKVTGLSTEELQRFNYASSLIDVSTETLQSSLKKLVRNMQTASSGTGDAYEAFKALGVTITDSAGQLRNNEEVFYDVIDALGRVENVTQRDAYAMNIFGKSAQDLNPLIIAGSDALKEYGDQAERMGLVFDQNTLDKLNEANDKIDVAKQQLEGVKMLVGSELVESFDSLFGGVDKLLKAVQEAKEDGTLSEIADAVSVSLKFLIDILVSAARFIYKYKEAVAAAVIAMVAFKTALDIAKLIKATSTAFEVYSAVLKKAAASQGALNTVMSACPYIAVAAGIALITKAIIDMADASENDAFYEYIDSIKATAEENNEAVKSYNALKESMEGSHDARQKTISEIENLHAGYQKMIDRLYELDSQTKLTNEAQAEMKSIIEQLEQAIPNLNIELDAQTGHIKTQKDELREWIDASEDYKKAQAAMQAQTEAYSELFSLEASQKKLKNESNDIRTQITDLINEKKQLDDFFDIDAEAKLNLSGEEKLEREKAAERYGEIERELDVLYLQSAEVSGALTDVEEKISNTNDEIGFYSDTIESLTDEQKKLIESTEDQAESAESLAERIEENTKAYDNAKSRLSAYKSELSNLLSILKEVNSGTKYSTSQILDLIEKYPQLASAVKLTADGYTVEAESIEALVKQKAELMLATAREAEAEAERLARAAARSTGEERFMAAEYFKQYQEAKKYAENIRTIVDDIQSGNIKQGSSAAASSSIASNQSTDTTDYWKQAAEAEISEAEHLYKMGEISAEEYYKRLEDINRRYYESRAEYLNEYNKLAETIYTGLNKLEEEQLSSTQSLIDKINALKKARLDLENAENQKVRVYSSAAGFHSETNSAAVDSAAQSLQNAQFDLAKLLQSKFNMKIELPDISGLDLRTLLPDLTKIEIPSASQSGSRQTTVNYHAGNIYVSGNADNETVDRIRELMQSQARGFFDEYLSDFLEQADRDRQTGGD